MARSRLHIRATLVARTDRIVIEVLGNRTYRHLFAAQVIALAGTGILTVALGLLAFQLAGEQAGAVLGTALAIKMIAYCAAKFATSLGWREELQLPASACDWQLHP